MCISSRTLWVFSSLISHHLYFEYLVTPCQLRATLRICGVHHTHGDRPLCDSTETAPCVILTNSFCVLLRLFAAILVMSGPPLGGESKAELVYFLFCSLAASKDQSCGAVCVGRALYVICGLAV